jgi:transcriptional regulatory protein LEU3
LIIHFHADKSLGDLDKFNALLVKLEIQFFYLIPPAGQHPESARTYVLRTFHTASLVLRNAQELDQKMEFLGHITHFQLRSIIAASCVIFRILRSSYMRFLDVKSTEDIAADATSICMRMSVVEGDLAARLSSLLKSFLELYRTSGWTTWGNEEPTVTGLFHRLGASITFDCLIRWKHDGTLQRAFGQQKQQQQQQQQQQQLPNPMPSNNEAIAQDSDTLLPSSTLPDQLDMDWTFLDDLDLTFVSNLGPPMQWWHGMAR